MTLQELLESASHATFRYTNGCWHCTFTVKGETIEYFHRGIHCPRLTPR